MKNGVQFYSADLKDIQGKYIPKLACYGYYGGGWCYAIGTSIAGTHLSTDNKISRQAKSRAFKALNEIHKRGVLRNDIRAENVFLDDIGHVFLVDFENALRPDQKQELNGGMCYYYVVNR